MKTMTTTTWNWMNNDRKNSQFPSFCLNKTPRQYHKQHAKQSTDLSVTLTGSLDLQCQNEQTERSKRSMILMQETSLCESLRAFYKENYTYLWRSQTKINNNTHSKKQHNLQQSWPGVIIQNVSKQLVHGIF